MHESLSYMTMYGHRVHVKPSCAGRDARAVTRLQNARADRAKHVSRDCMVVDRGIIGELKYFVLWRHELSIEKHYVEQIQLRHFVKASLYYN